MLYDPKGADGRLDVDGEVGMGTDREGEDGQEAFFGELLSRFGEVGDASPSIPPVRPRSPSNKSGQGSLSSLVKGLSEPLESEGDVEGDPGADNDDELGDFLASLEEQDKDAEAAKVLSALESMEPSPEGDAYIPPSPDPDELTTTSLTLKELFGLDGEEEAPPEAPESPRPQDPLAPRRLFAERRLYHFVRELVPDSETFAILRFMLTSGLDRLTLSELEGSLVQHPEVLKPRLDALVTGGVLVVDAGRYSANPRSRNALLLGQLVATWHEPGGRERIWGWFQERGSA